MIGGLSALLSFGLRRDPSAIRSVLLNESAPQFTLRVLDGNSVIRLTDFRGRPVVVNFWASWCADCRLEHPNLVAAWRRFGPRGVVFVNVVFEDSLANASRFIRQLGSDGIQVLDPAGRTAIEYGVYGIPETFFIDGRGVILDKKIGPSTYPFLVAEIEHLMGREAARGG